MLIDQPEEAEEEVFHDDDAEDEDDSDGEDNAVHGLLIYPIGRSANQCFY